MASRNVILYDKDDNQLAPATLSELVEYDDNNTVKDKIIELNERIDNLVTGNVEPLEVTANGTYTAPQGVDGFSPVTVNVPATETLLSEIDLTDTSSGYRFYDSVKKISLPTNNYVGLGNGKIVARNNKLFTGNYLNVGTVVKAEIKLGTFDRTIETSDTQNTLINLMSGNNHFMLMWRNDLGYWQYRDASGNMGYLQDITDKYYFENKTIIVYYGAKYVNGELYRVYNNEDYTNRFSLWVDDGINLIELIANNGESVAGDTTNTIGLIRLGSRGSDSLVGAVFESVKVWQYFNKYDSSNSVNLLGNNSINNINEINEVNTTDEISTDNQEV